MVTIEPFLDRKGQNGMLLVVQWEGLEIAIATYVPTEKKVHVDPFPTHEPHMAQLAI